MAYRGAPIKSSERKCKRLSVRAQNVEVVWIIDKNGVDKINFYIYTRVEVNRKKVAVLEEMDTNWLMYWELVISGKLDNINLYTIQQV